MHRNIKAFTIIELLVSTSIITAILSVVFWNYKGFNDRLAVSSAGQEMAVSIRQAQAYGINVRENAVGGGQFNYSYGMYFNKATPSSYIIFVDSNSNRKYDVGEAVETLSLRNGVLIDDICDSVNTCPAAVGINKMNITFTRPNPDAVIYFADTSGNNQPSPVSLGKVKLISPKGIIVYVSIEVTGQITVQ